MALAAMGRMDMVLSFEGQWAGTGEAWMRSEGGHSLLWFQTASMNLPEETLPPMT